MTYIPNEIAELPAVHGQIKRPLMRYFGGKWKIASWICSYFPEHRVYVEPFGGTASVLLTKAPAKIEIYNDLSSELANLFRVLRCPDRSKKLIELLKLTPYSKDEFHYAFPKVRNSVEQARRTIVLCSFSRDSMSALRRVKTGFRSASRQHQYLTDSWQSTVANMPAIVERLKSVMIENTDALSLIRVHDSPETLFYFDPPYPKQARRKKQRRYLIDDFEDGPHEALADAIKNLQGMAIISGYDCPLYNRLYTQNGWIPHSIQGRADTGIKGETLTTEVIWLSPKTAGMQRQTSIQF